MSTRPEKYIHQKESTEDRHKRDYSTELFEEWIASQGNEDMMDLDDNGRDLFFIIILRYHLNWDVLHLIRHPLIRSVSTSSSSDADGSLRMRMGVSSNPMMQPSERFKVVMGVFFNEVVYRCL
ncbi:hypothetical protein BDC45DRAFT_576387 [Circinella umbellata]|nr:hypothetical protein BDC45DRAFT_576387 [Circinella umbellata]